MKNLLAGAATLAIAAAFSAPAMAQTTQGDPVTGVSPQGTPLVASACNETDLAQTESMIGEAPEDLRPALMQRLAVAQDHQNDEQFQQCAQELARIETMVQARSASASGSARMSGSTGSSSTGTAGAAMGTGAAMTGSSTQDPAVAASCNETDLAEVSDMINQAPESQQAMLRQRLQTARDLGSDQENLECAQALAEIRQSVQGGTGSSQ